MAEIPVIHLDPPPVSLAIVLRPGGWTGYVYQDQVNWPAEHTTFTTAAALLAQDALAEHTGGAGVVRGTGLVAEPEPWALECGCTSADALAGHA